MNKKELNEEYTRIMDKHGAFWAFSDKQFEEKKAQGVKYTQSGVLNGLICPVDNMKALLNDFKTATIEHKKYMKKRIQDKSERKKQILHALNNYECFYTEDITDAVAELKGLGISEDEVRRVFNSNFAKYVRM